MVSFTRTDIPLNRDPSARYLPWLLGIMCYFAVLAAVGALASHRLASHWDFTLASIVTVQLPPAENTLEDARRLDQAMRIMRTQPGLLHLRQVDPKESAALLRPLLGDGLLAELPLPRLFDMHFDRPPALSPDAFRARLAGLFPDATVEAHGPWRRHVAGFTDAVAALGLTVLFLVTGAAAIAVIFAVRTSVSIHHEVISILHLIGAHDSYIAAGFQIHMLKTALRGGIPGALLAFITLWGLSLLPEAAFADWSAWTLTDRILAASPPLLIAIVAWIAARFSVLWSLRRMSP